MNIYQFFNGLRKCRKGKVQIYKVISWLKKCELYFLILVILAFCVGDLYAQHLFSVSYNDLSQENVKQIKAQIASSNASIPSLTKSMKDEYTFSLSSVQNTKIILVNEETGKNVVITPVEVSSVQFRLQLFFIEELRHSALGDADRYLLIETGADLSVRNTASLMIQTEEVFIPRYFYGPKENVKEALPKDRKIIHIFKEKPRLIPVFPDSIENLLHVAQLEEEMSYFVYMYQLPDGTLSIYDEHFILSMEKNGVSSGSSTNLQFNLSGNLDTQQQAATLHATGLWNEHLKGTVPIDLNVTFSNTGAGYLGASYTQPHYWNPATQTWYCSTLGNQLAGYNVTPDMSDIRIEMNSYYNWNYSITNPPSSSQYDWISVILHEITHGLGFYSMIKADGGYNYNIVGWQINANNPSIYDRQLYQGTLGYNLTDLNQSQRASLVVSNNLYAGRPGSNLLVANNNNRVKMYAPTIFFSNSSISHWDVSGTPILMRHSISSGFRHIVIDAREVAIMLDIGWGSTPVILGATGICPESIFSMSNGQSATWSVSSGFIITSNNGYSVTVKGNPINGQSGVLTAKMNGVTYTANIKACTGILGPDCVFACGSPTTFPFPNGDAYSWQVSPTNIFTIVSSSASHVTISTDASNVGEQGVISVTTCSSCPPITKSIYVRACNSPSPNLFYPNPVSNILNIEIDATSGQDLGLRSNDDHVYDIRLYDNQGNLLRQTTTTDGAVQFNVSALPVGIYYLHIYDGVSSTPVMEQIMVEH